MDRPFLRQHRPNGPRNFPPQQMGNFGWNQTAQGFSGNSPHYRPPCRHPSQFIPRGQIVHGQIRSPITLNRPNNSEQYPHHTEYSRRGQNQRFSQFPPNCNVQHRNESPYTQRNFHVNRPRFQLPNSDYQNELNTYKNETRNSSKCGYAGERKGNFNNNKPKKKKERKEKEFPFFCEICDRGFKTDEKYKEHCDLHKTCHVDGCSFTAAPKLVKLHYDLQHKTGLAKKVWNLQSPEDIEKWRADRKRNFPTKENVERKRKELQERIERGEVIESKQFGRMRGRGRGRGRGQFTSRERSDSATSTMDGDDAGSEQRGRGRHRQRTRKRRRSRDNRPSEKGDDNEDKDDIDEDMKDNMAKDESVEESKRSEAETAGKARNESEIDGKARIESEVVGKARIESEAEPIPKKKAKLEKTPHNPTLDPLSYVIKDQSMSEEDSDSEDSTSPVRQSSHKNECLPETADSGTQNSDARSAGVSSSSTGVLGALSNLVAYADSEGSDESDEEPATNTHHVITDRINPAPEPLHSPTSASNRSTAADINTTTSLKMDTTVDELTWEESKTTIDSKQNNQSAKNIEPQSEKFTDSEPKTDKSKAWDSDSGESETEFETSTQNCSKSVKEREENMDSEELNAPKSNESEEKHRHQKQNNRNMNSKKKRGQQNNQKNNRKTTSLLQKLLAGEIRHERNVLLQCVRHIVAKNFFQQPEATAAQAQTDSQSQGSK